MGCCTEGGNTGVPPSCVNGGGFCPDTTTDGACAYNWKVEGCLA